MSRSIAWCGEGSRHAAAGTRMMSRRRCRTLCGLRSFTFARERIELRQAGEPEALPVKGLRADKDETLEQTGSVVYAGVAPNRHPPRQWFLTFVFDERAVSLCRIIQCIDRALNLHIDTIARLVVPKSRLIFPPLRAHQYFCVLCFRFIVLIKSTLGRLPRLR